MKSVETASHTFSRCCFITIFLFSVDNKSPCVYLCIEYYSPYMMCFFVSYSETVHSFAKQYGQFLLPKCFVLCCVCSLKLYLLLVLSIVETNTFANSLLITSLVGLKPYLPVYYLNVDFFSTCASVC